MDPNERAKRARIRLATYTFGVLLVFASSHVGLTIVIRPIEACAECFGSVLPRKLVWMGAWSLVAYLYLRAWIEFGRLIHARWLRRTEFLARFGVPPIPEPIQNPAILREHLWLFVVATAFCFGIAVCAGLDPNLVHDRGPIAGLLAGIIGLPSTVFGSWMVRVQEPYLPFD